jgi:AraC family ethanolamine operon transcriptional activator
VSAVVVDRSLARGAAAALAGSLAPVPPSPLGGAGVSDIRTTSLEELQASSRGWDVRYVQLGTGEFRCRHGSVRTARLQICLEAWSLGILKMGRGPRGSVTFLVPVGGAGSVHIQGRPVGIGGVAVLFAEDELDCRSAGPAQIVSVSVQRSELEDHVRALLGQHLGELRLRGHLSGLRTDAGALARLFHDVKARAAARPRLLQDASFAISLERELVNLLLSELSAPREPEGPSRGRALARRAEAWLRRNLAERPTIAVLCEALGASERTVYEAFRKYLDTTPKAYLKTLRLNAAHHDLLQGAATTRVTDVALDWGFEHFGWFSQDYRRLFGETPSDTLHRGRARAACLAVAARGHASGGTTARPHGVDVPVFAHWKAPLLPVARIR